MISNLLKSVFGSRNDRLLKQYRQTVIAINALEAQIEALTDDELRAKTVAFKQRVQQGKLWMPCCLKLLRLCVKAPARTADAPFRCAVNRGMVLHYGKIAEMRTGEGKTLMATLPAY